MKKTFLFIAISWTILLSWPCTHATTVNPSPGDSTWTLVSRLGQVSDETTPIPVFNSDQAGGIITLSATGNYRVAENLIYPIVISTDEVCLDLNCKEILSSNGSTNLLTVNNDLKYIAIHNGSLVNIDTPTGTGAGILIQNSSSLVQVENVKISGCGNGIKLNGQNGNEIIECKLVALDLVSNTTGLVLNHADENIIKDCCASHNTQAGFELLDSEANCFYDCQALKTFGGQSTMGFTSRAGQSNLFQRCVSKKTKTSAWEFCNKAYGFLLTSTEEKTKIIDCIVNETDVTSTISAIAYGIHLDPILLEVGDLLNYITGNDEPGNNVSSVAWSPNGKYIVSGDDGNYVRVFSFDGLRLDYITSNSFDFGFDVNSVAWSPDGKYIASGDADNFVRTFSFDGSLLHHINGDGTPASAVQSVVWSNDGKYIASGDASNYVRVFSFDGLQLDYITSNSFDFEFNVNSVSWSPDCKYIVSGDDGNYVRIFSFDGSNLLHIDSNGTAEADVNSVAWSPNGNYIASGDDGNKVQVFSFDGQTLSHIDDDPATGAVLSVAWSPDGKYIVSGDDGNYMQVSSFDGSNLTLIKDSTIQISDVFSVAWSPDGNYIASGDAGGDTGDYVHTFDAMYGPQNCLVDSCRVCDTSAYGQFVGTGIAGGGNNYFVSNVCCNNDANYTYGVPNVFYGGYNIERNTVRPFDNISMPTTQ